MRKKGSANELLGLDEEKAHEIFKAFQHAKIEYNNWADVVKEVIKKTGKTKEDYAFIGYTFGRMYEQMEGGDVGKAIAELEELLSK